MAFYYLFPILIALLYDPRSAPLFAAVPTTLLALCLATQIGVAGVLFALGRRLIARRGEGHGGGLRALSGALRIGLLVLLAIYFVQIHLLHAPLALPYPGTVLGDLLLLLPFFAVVLLARMAAFPALRALRSLDCSAGTYLRFHLRALLVFAGPPLLYVLLLRVLVDGWPAVALVLAAHPGLILVAVVLLVGGLVGLAPFLVRHLFPRMSLRAAVGAERQERLRARFAGLSAGLGARLGRVFVWQTGGLRVANAAVAGLVRPLQHVFVSDTLLEGLGDDEVSAVLAHEMGHTRLRHPLLNVLLALSAVGLLTLAVSLLWPLADTGGAPPAGPVLPLLILGFNVAYIFTVFRFFLNRFEYQADAMAAEATGSVDVFAAALVRIVVLNDANPGQGSITHPSVTRRLAALRKLTDPVERRAWLRRERRRNLAAAALAVAIVTAAAITMELLA